MAISWAQGLLAGAAGVTEYSEQEQLRRQQRNDVATKLENDMRMTQAKSKYASKMKQYEENRVQMDALRGVKPGGFDEQVRLFQTLGYSESSAAIRASAVMAGKAPRIQRPTEMAEPTLNFKSQSSTRASSPLEDWVQNFRKPPKTFEPAGESLQNFAQQPLGSAEPIDTDQADTEGEVTPVGGDAATQEQQAEGQLEPQIIGGQEFAVDPNWVNPLAKPVAPEILRQDGSQGNQAGEWVVGMNKATGEQEYRVFFAKGETSDKLIAPHIVQNSDGSKIAIGMKVDAQGNQSETGERWRTQIKTDPNTGKSTEVVGLELPTREQYIRRASGSAAEAGQQSGQFYTDFPDAERELWKAQDTESFFFTETPEGFEETMADSMLFVKKRQAAHVPPNKIDDPKFMAQLNARAKALAYVKTFEGDVQSVIDAVEAGAIEPSTFFSRSIDRKSMPSMRAIQDGILNLPEYAKEKSKHSRTFTNSLRF